jgi:preprotein translocase subunit YajC
VTGLLIIVALLLVMWLVLVRPQRRRQLAQQEMIDSLAVGDEIVTAGGLYGEIEEVWEDQLRVEIAPGTSVRIDKRAVATVVRGEDEEEDEEAGEFETASEVEAASEAEPAGEPGESRREQAASRPARS